MSHDPYWHEREPSMCGGCEREHYERRREQEEAELAAYEAAALYPTFEEMTQEAICDDPAQDAAKEKE